MQCHKWVHMVTQNKGGPDFGAQLIPYKCFFTCRQDAIRTPNYTILTSELSRKYNHHIMGPKSIQRLC